MCIRSYLKSVLSYNVLIWDNYHPDTIYESKDMTIRGYFSKPKGVRDQKCLGNTDLDELQASGDIQPHVRWNVADMLDIGYSAHLLQSCYLSGLAPTPC